MDDGDFELPDDLKDDVEIIYSDSEDDDDDQPDPYSLEDVLESVDINDEEVVDLAKFTFTKHTQSVFCGDVSSDDKLAVTGGQDDAAYVWDLETGDIVLECTGHRDSVVIVQFNHTNQYVVTADMGGMIQVWDVIDKKLIWCFEGDDLHWLTWHGQANVLVAGFQAGDIYVWQIPQGNTKVLPTAGFAHTTHGKILPNGKQLLASYQGGLLKLWDLKTVTAVWQCNLDQPIFSFDINADASLAILTPSGQLVKMSDGKIVTSFLVGDEAESDMEVAHFDSDLGMYVTGGLSGMLCVWDVRKQALRHKAQLLASVTILKQAKSGIMFVGGADGIVYVCDVKQGTHLETLTGHRQGILSMKPFANGTKLLTTGDDGVAKIFDIKS